MAMSSKVLDRSDHSWALLGGSPKLLKAVPNRVQGQQLLEQWIQEEKRQGMTPKLGVKKEREAAPPQDNAGGWKQL
eukprot:4309190-Amphidinium_carterae.3